MARKNIAIIGFGQRGQTYAEYTKSFPDDMKLVAACDTKEARREKAKAVYNADVYVDYKELLDKGYELDLVVISTQDKQHKEHAIYALERGYDLLLEKPISVTQKDCMDIYKCAKKNNRRVFVCHVLRYSPFYSKIKEIIDSGELGEVMTIHASENVGYFHQAHSFVRGPWKNSNTSSPMILAKCCHDLDIIRYLIGERCESVNSYGELSYFNKKNKPENATKYCSDCPLAKDCAFNAKKIYCEKFCNGWLSSYFHQGELNPQAVEKSLRHSDYDICVFDCDNNVVDHQTTIMKFENGKTATHTMTGFSKDCYRDIKVYGTKAELYGLMENNCVEIRPFDGDKRTIEINSDAPFGAHGGSDYHMMVELNKVLNGEKCTGVTFLEVSMESHLMAFGAEKSRTHNGRTQKIKKLK